MPNRSFALTVACCCWLGLLGVGLEGAGCLDVPSVALTHSDAGRGEAVSKECFSCGNTACYDEVKGWDDWYICSGDYLSAPCNPRLLDPDAGAMAAATWGCFCDQCASQCKGECANLQSDGGSQ